MRSFAPNGRSRSAVGVIVLVGCLCGGWTASGEGADEPADRFVAALDAHSAIPAEARALIKETWTKCIECDGAEFLVQGLSVLSPRFREGLDAYDREDYVATAKIMAALRSDGDPFLAHHGAVYEIKALVALERMTDALERISALRADGGAALEQHTYDGAEIAFLHGFCLLQDLQYEEAEKVLMSFLVEHGDAPQRLVLSAQQMLAELEHRQAGRIGEVVDLMQFAGRRLSDGDSGDRLQGRQQRIIELLDRLIKDAEEQEQSSSSSSSSEGSGGGSQNRRPQTPMQQSRLPQGAPSGEWLEEGRRANPGEVWGAMPPGERERILQALRESFPNRYRRLVEQYYEELAKKP